MCEVAACDRPINKDGLCFKHKIETIHFGTHHMKMERNDADVTGGRGTAAYVRDMYETRRANGQEDPIPANKKAATFAPRRKITEGGYA